MSKVSEFSKEYLESTTPPILPDAGMSQQAFDLLKGKAADLAIQIAPMISDKVNQVIDFTTDLGVENILNGVCQNKGRELTANNMDKLLNLASKLPDGKIETAKLGDVATIIAGGCLDPETAALIKNVQSIEKRGNHFEINFNKTTSIKVGEKVPGTAGLVELSNLQMDKISFDLDSRNGTQRLTNLQGLNLKFDGPMGYNFDGSVKSVTMYRDESGNLQYQAQLTQKSLLANIIGAPKELTVNMKTDQNGHFVVLKPEEVRRSILRSVVLSNLMSAAMPGGVGHLVGDMIK